MQVGFFRAATVALAFSCFATVAAAAEGPAEFYKGKTIQIVIPAGHGGSVGLYGRLVTDFIGRHVPGEPNAILVSRPGAGGVTATSFIYSVAPSDGTVIGNILAPTLLVPLLRDARYDPTKFQWLGSLTARPGVFAVWHKAPAATLEDAKKIELNFGSTGIGAGNYQMPTLANAVLGTRFKIVTGYKSGGDINLGIETGELDGRFNYWSGWTSVKSDWIRDKKLTFLLRTGPRAPDMPDLPAFRELVSGDERQMVRFLESPDNIGVGFWIAPGVPSDRTAALRKAFWEMMHDEAFLAEANKRRAPIAPVRSDELDKIVAEMYGTPKAVIDRVKDIMSPKR